MRFWWMVVAALFVGCSHVSAPAPTGPPIARTEGTVDHVFGLDVPDPYRWMETNADERDAWLHAQGAYTKNVLAHLPDHRALAARVKELAKRSGSSWDLQFEHGRFIYSLRNAHSSVPMLATRDPSGAERILIDPKQFGSATEHAAVTGYTLSPDGMFVCYVLSHGSKADGTLYVLDIATGKHLTDVVQPVVNASQPCRWTPDARRFFYTQSAATGGVERLHVVGQRVDQDVTLIDHSADGVLKLAPEERPDLTQWPDAPWVVATIGDTRSEFRVAVARASELDLTGARATPWRIVAGYGDGVVDIFVHGDRLYLLTFAGAPNRKLVSVPLDQPDLSQARVEIAEDPDATLEGVANAADAGYVVRGVNGRARLSRWTWGGPETPIPLPADGWVADLTTGASTAGLVFRLDTWLRPSAYYAYDPATSRVSSIGFGATAIAASLDVVADDVEVPNGDVSVPLTVLHQRSAALDGSHPTLIYAYGAYGRTVTPGFSLARAAWLERGGVIAIAHVRGGGERGRRWQDGGARDKKLDGVHDLIACADYLVAQKWTAPARLGVTSNGLGGIVVGRAITLRPELFAAASIAAGLVNPSRLAASENGAAQKGELGDPATESGLRALLDMDPYQHVTPHTAYPAVLFSVGLDDHVVSPWQSAKLAARLMAATTSGRPILVQVDADAGHDLGWSGARSRAESVDIWSFMLSQFR